MPGKTTLQALGALLGSARRTAALLGSLWLAACGGSQQAEADGAAAPAVDVAAPQAPQQAASDPEPTADAAPPSGGAAVSDSLAAAPNGCRTGKSLPHAMAIPQGKTGTIEIVITDQLASCTYWTDAPNPQGCDFWRARVHLGAASQQPGQYRLEQDFAHLDRKILEPQGAWQKTATCRPGGGSLKGVLEIERIEQDRIVGHICQSETGDPRDRGLVDGSFTALRCPACQMTGDPCTTNKDCCANFCSQGRCRP